MDALKPGHYWKTPFICEPGCPAPTARSALTFEPAETGWLADACAEAMASSLDESDRWAVAQHGPAQAVAELLSFDPGYFRRVEGWWSAAVDADGRRIGFVLPVLFESESRWKDGRPQGTIFSAIPARTISR